MRNARLTNAFFLLLGVLRWLGWGSARLLPSVPRKIAVFQMGKLGDMVCTTPMFRAIKERYPESRVYVIGDRVNEGLLKYQPYVDRYVVYNKNPWEVIRLLRKERIDFAAVAIPSPDVLAILYLAGIPAIAAPLVKNGFSPMETRSYRFLRKFVIRVPHRMGRYAPREYLRLLEPLGIRSDDTTKRLAFSEAGRSGALEFLAEHGLEPGRDFIVGIAPSTGYGIKYWAPEKFARIADYLLEKYQAKVILTGAAGDLTQVEETMRLRKPSTPFINACGRFNLDEFKAFVSQLSLFISVDTGPIYVAEAFNVPTIDIVGPMDEREQPPVGARHRVVLAPFREKPEIHILNVTDYDEKEARRQSEAISAEMVMSEIDSLMPLITQNV